MDVAGKKIGFALTGSFCTLAAVQKQAERLKEAGADLYPIFSENVWSMDTRFGTAEHWKQTFETLCGHPIIHTIADAEPIGPRGYLDCVVIAPCSGNTLGKLALGITDGPVIMAAKAELRNNKPVVIAVSTNDGLGKSAQNIASLLNTHHVYMVPFGQDQPFQKTNSLVARMDQILNTVESALDGHQIQPVLAGPAGTVLETGGCSGRKQSQNRNGSSETGV